MIFTKIMLLDKIIIFHRICDFPRMYDFTMGSWRNPSASRLRSRGMIPVTEIVPRIASCDARMVWKLSGWFRVCDQQSGFRFQPLRSPGKKPAETISEVHFFSRLWPLAKTVSEPADNERKWVRTITSISCRSKLDRAFAGDSSHSLPGCLWSWLLPRPAVVT